ncbi:hypothetical protein HRG84_11140 [Flavisolibacter sp. BT320]|nr:hypothetical protein [Flavisolibacter longurius]
MQPHFGRPILVINRWHSEKQQRQKFSVGNDPNQKTTLSRSAGKKAAGNSFAGNNSESIRPGEMKTRKSEESAGHITIVHLK